MTAGSNEQCNDFHVDRLQKSYVKPGLPPQNESGSRIISVARFDKLEVRLIEFVDRNGRDSKDLWVELYRHDTQSSIDSCRCRDFEEVQNFGGDLISQARLSFKSSGHVASR